MAAHVECGEPPCLWPQDRSVALARMSACALAGGVPDSTGLRCCSASCGTCGGDNCMSREGGAAACCADDIDSADVPCGSPPCLMETTAVQQFRVVPKVAQACLDIGGIPDALGLICCSSSCGVCGGADCESRPGGAAACCGDALMASAQECGHPPCTLEVDAEAARARSYACLGAGGVPDESGMFCCSSACGMCGGPGCDAREGGASACCADSLEAANVACGDPPCLMETHASAQARDAAVFSAKCRDKGGIPDSSGLKCCAESCGVCGGEGCEMRPGGAEQCCGDSLSAANETCGQPGCIFRTNPREVEARASACEAVGGILDPNGLACCPSSCGACGGEGCASRTGGAGACCGDSVEAANKLCGHPPCLMIAFSDEGPGADKQEWWRFNSGNLVEAGSSNANHHPCFWSLGIGLPCDWGMGFGSKEASSLEPMTILKMHDTKVPTGANQVGTSLLQFRLTASMRARLDCRAYSDHKWACLVPRKLRSGLRKITWWQATILPLGWLVG